MKRPKVNLSKFVVHWFEIVKYSAFIFISLIPAMVFKSYAPTGETYDAFYTIIILIMLMATDFGQASVVAYVNKRALEKEGKEDENERTDNNLL